MATKAYSYIRFSSAEQANGASQKRQIERAEEYARKRGWELDKSLAIDKGVSAWTGANIHEGSFKKFLDLVEKGKIPKGSVLIVESLDRISRQHFLDALVPFKKILSRDITIVSLIDGQEYTKDSIKNDFQMWCCLLSFQLANNESDKKSVRVKDAWKRKRDNISKNILYTKMAPFWLQWSEKKNWWEPVPDKIKTIRTIYYLALKGYGKTKICTYLNKEKVPPFREYKKTGRKQNGWHQSSIARLLSNRALIGELQPHRIERIEKTNEGGRCIKQRIPDGIPVQNYFPKIIKDQDFLRVQSKTNRKIIKGGRQSKLNTLFTGLIKCGHCGAPIVFVNKGNNAKYLVCDNAKRGLGCKYISVKYELFEKQFLFYGTNLNFNEILFSDQIDKANKVIAYKIEDITHKIEDNNSQVEFLLDGKKHASNETANKKYFDRVNTLTTEIEQLVKERAALIKQLENRSEIHDAAPKNIKTLRLFYKTLTDMNPDEQYELRAKTRLAIQSLVEKILLYPGSKVSKKENLHNKQNTPPIKSGIIKFQKPDKNNAVSFEQCFAVYLRNVSPDVPPIICSLFTSDLAAFKQQLRTPNTKWVVEDIPMGHTAITS